MRFDAFSAIVTLRKGIIARGRNGILGETASEIYGLIIGKIGIAY